MEAIAFAREPLRHLEAGSPLWVFGYGSIVWKWAIPGVTPLERRDCYVKGFSRRFHQMSTDHRGTLDFPGRVVTLEPAAQNDIVWGAAYKIDCADIDDALRNLEYREKQYDKRMVVDCFVQDADGEKVLCAAVTWIATSSKGNINWGGYAPLDDIADTIARASGPSGENKEYLFNLADAFRAAGVNCAHTFELEARVKAKMQCGI